MSKPAELVAAHGARAMTGVPTAGDYALLVALAAIWGSSFMFIKIAVEAVPPASLTALRLIVASAVLVPIALAAGDTMRLAGRTFALVLASALMGNALPFTLIAWGQQSIDSGLAAIVMGTMPLFTLVLAHVATHDEKLSGLKGVAVALGLAGIVVLIGPQKLMQLGAQTLAQLAVGAGAMCYAINTLISKKLIHEPRKGTAANVMAMSALMMLPLAWFADFRGATGPVFGNADAVQIGAIVLLGALHTGIATLILFRLISRAGATFFSQINFLVPVFGVAWGAIFLAERPGVNALVSLGLILSGIFIARLAQRRA